MNRTDKILELISVVLLIGSVLNVVSVIGHLPDTIPCHFTIDGTPDGYGSKHLLWIIVVISFALYMGFTGLTRYPEFYSTTITKKDKEGQIKLTQKTLRTIKPIILFVFLVINVMMTQSAQLKSTGFIPYLVPFILVAVFTPTIYFVIKMGKIK